MRTTLIPPMLKKGDCFFNKDNEPIATAPYENYNWTDKYNFLIEEKIPIIITSRIENGDLFYIKENFQKIIKM